jgi:hypothetical protein
VKLSHHPEVAEAKPRPTGGDIRNLHETFHLLRFVATPDLAMAALKRIEKHRGFCCQYLGHKESKGGNAFFPIF